MAQTMLLTWTATRGHSATMIICRCGGVFQSSGDAEQVDRETAAWQAQHNTCHEKKRDDRKVFWLSFCDADKPTGTQFLGACLIEVTAAEAGAACLAVALRFPLAQPDAEWLAAAITKARQIGCNPGGEVASVEIDLGNPRLARYRFGVLMDRATIERIDGELESPTAGIDPHD